MTVIQKKICLLGDFAVGKTSLVRQFVEGRFDDKYLSTIGVKISRKTLSVKSKTLNLLIWDLAGADEFQGISAGYLRGTAAALIVCDLTHHHTLASFGRHLEQLRAVSPAAKVIFLANKVDLTDQREISINELQEVCSRLGGPYLLTSAKTGERVDEAFRQLAEQLEV